MSAPIRVLVVDDSVVIRRLLTTIVDADPDLEVVATAQNGAVALTRIEQHDPDIVTLDVEMPVMDGLEALREIRRRWPRLPVIMFSTLTARGAEATLDALATGASDYVTKPANVGSVAEAMERVRTELAPKILALCRPHPAATRRPVPEPSAAVVPTARRASTPGAPSSGTGPIDLVVVGASTGGPQALAVVLSALPADLAVPVLVVQHMPPVFTRLLAERLDAICALDVREAERDVALEPGAVRIAPGDVHLSVRGGHGDLRLDLDDSPPVHFCRPAVDVLFRSAALLDRIRTLAVVLTGMGSDGRDGCRALATAGAEIVVQDRASSTVWGMPGAVATDPDGIDHRIVPLDEIGPTIARRAAPPRSVRLAATAP